MKRSYRRVSNKNNNGVSSGRLALATAASAFAGMSCNGVSVTGLSTQVSAAVKDYVSGHIKSNEVLRNQVLAHPHLLGLLQDHVDSVSADSSLAITTVNVNASSTATASADADASVYAKAFVQSGSELQAGSGSGAGVASMSEERSLSAAQKSQLNAEAQRAALDKARNVLNNMLKETEEQKDMTNEQCDKFKEDTMEDLDTARQGKSQCETDASKATAGLNQAKATADAASAKIEELKGSLKKEKDTCAADIG